MRTTRLILATIAIFAMLWAQVFGMRQGYSCDCGGVPRFTQADHCHGPHSSACHDHDHDHWHPGHSLADHAPDDGSHEHEPIVHDLNASQTPASLQLSADLAWTAVLAPEWMATLPSSYLHPIFATSPPARDLRRRCRDWPQVLARTIALRV